MALPTSYLTSVKNLPDIFAAMQGAQAPEKFTQGFLESLEFKSTADRLIIGMLKALEASFIAASTKVFDPFVAALLLEAYRFL